MRPCFPTDDMSIVGLLGKKHIHNESVDLFGLVVVKMVAKPVTLLTLLIPSQRLRDALDPLTRVYHIQQF
jgi:hypothetical protein